MNLLKLVTWFYFARISSKKGLKRTGSRFPIVPTILCSRDLIQRPLPAPRYFARIFLAFNILFYFVVRAHSKKFNT